MQQRKLPFPSTSYSFLEQRVTLKVTEGSRDGETRVAKLPFILLLEMRAWMPRSGTSHSLWHCVQRHLPPSSCAASPGEQTEALAPQIREPPPVGLHPSRSHSELVMTIISLIVPTFKGGKKAGKGQKASRFIKATVNEEGEPLGELAIVHPEGQRRSTNSKSLTLAP